MPDYSLYLCYNLKLLNMLCFCLLISDVKFIFWFFGKLDHKRSRTARLKVWSFYVSIQQFFLMHFYWSITCIRYVTSRSLSGQSARKFRWTETSCDRTFLKNFAGNDYSDNHISQTCTSTWTGDVHQANEQFKTSLYLFS